jgi:DNA-binding response OmpR family regulator
VSRHVLIVDDDPTTQSMLAEFLTFHGFAHAAASSGEEALATVEQTRPDLVLLDIGLPGMDGWETLKRLRARADTQSIPVVMLTSYDAVEDLIRGYSSGASYYVAKPYNRDELLRGLRMAFSETP